MKVLITGSHGMLGRTLCRVLKDFEVIATDRLSMDITNMESVDLFMREHRPDAVVHCAAMTAVDLCETHKDDAYKQNAAGSAIVASSCNRYGIRLIAISTDYVFDGNSERPYTEYDLPTGGATVYGQSKWAGEEAVRTLCPNHVIARVAWLYGQGGPSFVHTMLKLADGTRPYIKVVNDQIGNPTSTDAVSRSIREILLRQGIAGVFHLTCEGEATWFEFARKVFEFRGINQKVVPCSSLEYLRPAPRPLNSRLENMNLRLFGLPSMPNWEDELREVLSRSNF